MKETEKITVPPLSTSRFYLCQHGGADRFPEAFSCCKYVLFCNSNDLRKFFHSCVRIAFKVGKDFLLICIHLLNLPPEPIRHIRPANRQIEICLA